MVTTWSILINMRGKRTAEQVEQDREVAMELYLQGYSHQAIANRLNEGRPYELTRRQISYDIEEVRKRWIEGQREKYDAYVNQELARIDIFEREAWEAWRASGGKISEETIIEQLRSIGEDKSPELIVTEIKRHIKDSVGDPRFLEAVFKAQQERRKILGIYAPAKLGIKIDEEKRIIVKGYSTVDVSPDAWPDPPRGSSNLKLSDGIIEGEFGE